MEKGKIASWEKNVGDSVSEGDLLAEIETDKATVGLEASEDGFVAKIFIEAGVQDIPLGKPLCIIVPEESNVPAFADYEPSSEVHAISPGGPESSASEEAPDVPLSKEGASEQVSSAPQTTTTTTIESAPTFQVPPRIFATPLAKTLASEKGISLADLKSSSGPEGQFRAMDVLSFKSVPQPSQERQAKSASVGFIDSSSPYTDIELSGMRQTIAKRLSHSKQEIPHYYLTSNINMKAVSRLRQKLNLALAKEHSSASSATPSKLSINDFIVKAAAKACLAVPACNSSWMGDKIRQYNSVDVSIAVSTSTGLITPIVFNAHLKGLATINSEVVHLASKAREGKLQPNEFQGGTFTISNLGMFGIDSFTAIINEPQSCILSVGRSVETVIPDDSYDSGFSIVPFMAATLGADHRVVDGAVGAQWMQHFKKYMESPTLLLL